MNLSVEHDPGRELELTHVAERGELDFGLLIVHMGLVLELVLDGLCLEQGVVLVSHIAVVLL